MDEDEEMYRLMNEEDEFYMGDTDDGDDDVKGESQKYGCSKAGCVPLIIISSMLLGLFF
jgi:hypothetical protein